MFKAYQHLLPKLQAPKTMSAPSEGLVNPPCQAPTIEGEWDEIPLEQFGAFLAARDQLASGQPAPAPTPRASEAPKADMADVDLNGLLGMIGLFLGNNGADPATVNKLVACG